MPMDSTTCRLCGAALPEDDGSRCPNCGLHQAADLDRSGYRRLAAGLAGIYLLTALLVLLTRGR
jgi:predicted nucleic acid-binding Zn ribbon protein